MKRALRSVVWIRVRKDRNETPGHDLFLRETTMRSGIRLRIAFALFMSLLIWGFVNRVSALAGDKPVVVTFTKWLTTYPKMAGVVGGAVVGDFAGEVLTLQNSTNPDVTSITRLVAIYDIKDSSGPHSFTALIQGGQNNQTNQALLDGVILDGWQTGARVHVKYLVIANCAGNPTGPCFQGTITIEPDSEDSRD
jgi:hypothetical protein